MIVGLFFGSFNPIHAGHIEIARFMLRNTDMDEVWFVVSPQNPFKNEESLADGRHRLKMAELAIKGEKLFSVSDAEFHLPRPSFTINTLQYLIGQNPSMIFSIIMGEDNLQSLVKWKDYKKILRFAKVYVYPRTDAARNIAPLHSNIKVVDGPLHPQSATKIREAFQRGNPVSEFVCDDVRDYIEKNRLYNFE